MHAKYAVHLVYYGTDGLIRAATALEISTKASLNEIKAQYAKAVDESNYRTEVTIVPLGIFDAS